MHFSISEETQGPAHTRPEYLNDPQRSEKYRRYVTSLICSVLSIIFFLFMAVLNIAKNNYSIATVLLVCIFICVLCVLLQLSTGNAKIPAWLLCITHILLSWYLVFIGSPSSASLIWTFVYPQGFMLWLGLKRGTWLSLAFIASMMIFMFSPLSAFTQYQNKWDFSARYVITLSGLLLFAFLAEYIRDRLQKKLLYLNMQIKNTALTDPLTGLGNRLAFEQHLRTEYAKFLRQGDDLGLIMCDIDHFKKINDHKGHAVGDAVLQHTAELLSSRLRRQDAMFRWGGEEFIITIAGVPPHELTKLAEAMRIAIAETPCPYQEDKIYYTMSFGVHTCSMLEGPAEAMDKTDRLLYAAKRAGRNKVVSSDSTY